VLSMLINADAPDTQHLRELLEKQKPFADRNELTEEFWQSDNQFHKAIFELSDRDIWWHLLERFEPHYMRYRKLDMTDNNKVGLLYVHHKSILRIIEEKKPGEIEDILKSHIYCCIDRIPILLEKYPDYFCGY